MKKFSTAIEEEIAPDSVPGGLKSVYCISTMLATSTLAVVRKRRGCMRRIILTTAIAVILLPGARARAQGPSEADQLFETMMNIQADDAENLSGLATSPAPTTVQVTYALDMVGDTFSYSANTGQYINGMQLSLSCSGAGDGSGNFAWTEYIQLGDLDYEYSSTATGDDEVVKSQQIFQQPNGVIIWDNTDTIKNLPNADGSSDSYTTRVTVEHNGHYEYVYDPKTGQHVKDPVTGNNISRLVYGDYITTTSKDLGKTDHKDKDKVVLNMDMSNWWVANSPAGLDASGGGGQSTLDIYAVPEPSTSALLSIGAFGLLAYEWRRRTAKA